MGAINKRSSLPASPSLPPSVVVAPIEPEKTSEEIQMEARKASLLRRSRGRFGTILSGFRGFLDSADGAQESGRKTLLGE